MAENGTTSGGGMSSDPRSDAQGLPRRRVTLGPSDDRADQTAASWDLGLPDHGDSYTCSLAGSRPTDQRTELNASAEPRAHRQRWSVASGRLSFAGRGSRRPTTDKTAPATRATREARY